MPVTLVAYRVGAGPAGKLGDLGLSTGAPLVTVASGKVLRGTGYEVEEVERLWVPISRCTGWGLGCSWVKSRLLGGNSGQLGRLYMTRIVNYKRFL